MRAAPALALVSVLTGCGAAASVWPQAHAENACNRWSAAIEAGSTPEQTHEGLLQAASSARRAADLDDGYDGLADSLERLQVAGPEGDVAGLLDASDAAFDEC